MDYLAVGHVTVDVLEDGARQPGGTAFYGALQASRLGLRSALLTRGRQEEIRALLAPFAHELEVTVLAAEATTTLATRGEGERRRQRLLAWAGPIAAESVGECSILHMAPVAREVPLDGPTSGWGLLGLSAQGLLRTWDAGEAGEISLAAPEPAALELARRCDAIVCNESERTFASDLLAAASAGGATLAVTAGPRPSTILTPDGRRVELAVPELAEPVDDLGAGDVYAAALFVALAEGRDAAAAGAFAKAAAAVRMRGRGPGAIGRREEIERRLAETSAGAV